ncbi:unnamed protein product [marine sediment metagenome]|uniref:Uncharacterized protein n=1 Tax=marine sediment metagenome TaxID=412755 RepID=X0XJ02_9ZZZZ
MKGDSWEKHLRNITKVQGQTKLAVEAFARRYLEDNIWFADGGPRV